MSIRSRLDRLELRPGACPLCAGVPAVDFHTVAPGETVPQRACQACGVPRMAFVVEIPPEPITENRD